MLPAGHPRRRPARAWRRWDALGEVEKEQSRCCQAAAVAAAAPMAQTGEATTAQSPPQRLDLQRRLETS